VLALPIRWRSRGDVARMWGGDEAEVGAGSYAFGWWLSSELGVLTWHPNELWVAVRRSESWWGGWDLPIRV